MRNGKCSMFSLIVLVGLLCSCASPYMTRVVDADVTLEPEAGKALVHFMRPSSLGGGIQSYLYDGEQYIGTVSAGTRVSYQADPGEHLFMVTGDTADFMMADVVAGSIYHAVISAYPGFVTYRFAFRPVNDQVADEELNRWFTGTREVVVNPKGEEWANDNEDRAAKFQKKYLPSWQRKDEADKQRLLDPSGS